MDETKKKELVTMLGGDQAAVDKVESLLTQSDSQQKQAVDAGIAHKENETKPETKPDDKSWFLADMKPEEFGALLATGIAKALEPIQADMKAIKDWQVVSAKESKDNSTAITSKVDALAKSLETTATKVAILEGLTPKGYRASQDPATVVSDAKVKESMPTESYFKSFVDELIGASKNVAKP